MTMTMTMTTRIVIIDIMGMVVAVVMEARVGVAAEVVDGSGKAMVA